MMPVIVVVMYVIFIVIMYILMILYAHVYVLCSRTGTYIGKCVSILLLTLKPYILNAKYRLAPFVYVVKLLCFIINDISAISVLKCICLVIYILLHTAPPLLTMMKQNQS